MVLSVRLLVCTNDRVYLIYRLRLVNSCTNRGACGKNKVAESIKGLSPYVIKSDSTQKR